MLIKNINHAKGFYPCIFFFILIIAMGNYTKADAQKEPGRRGGELWVALPKKPVHLNPAVQSGTYTGIPGIQIFATLLRIDRNWNYQPYLAKKWEISPDGLTVRFYLRKGAAFHDGKPITSKDVAFSIMTVKKFHPYPSMLKAVDKVETPDLFTVEVRLKQPHPALLLVAGSPMLPILPKHIFDDGQDIKTHSANKKPVGSGPFKCADVNDFEIVLERYNNFFLQGRPYLDKVIIKIVPENTFRVAFETGSVHAGGFIRNADVITKLETSENIKRENIKIDYDGYLGIGPIRFLMFNMQKPPFDDLRVRQAVAYAIDRKFLVNSLFKGKAKPATGPVYPGAPFYTGDVELYDLDVSRANELLDEAGYPRNAKGMRFSAALDFTSASPEMSDFLRMDLLRKTGINLHVIANKKFSDYAGRLSNWDYSLALISNFNFGDPVIGVHRTYSSKNIRKGVMFSNMSGYKNKRVDLLMDKAGMEMNPGKREKLYHEFQQIIAKELPVYPITALSFASIYLHQLKGMQNSIWGTMFPYDSVYWEK